MRILRSSPRVLAVIVAAIVTACGDDGPAAAPTTTAPAGRSAEECVVRVHGRSETGALPVERDGYLELAPIGTTTSGDGHMWEYDDPDDRADGLARITEAVDAAGCERVVLHGFSNGGGFVGALVCDGEDLDGRLVGAVVDDPVPDEGTEDCDRDPELPVVVYWTGALVQATPGATCESLGWICAGDTVVGIDAYAAGLGVDVTASPMTEHAWFDDAPEVREFLSPAS